MNNKNTHHKWTVLAVHLPQSITNTLTKAHGPIHIRTHTCDKNTQQDTQTHSVGTVAPLFSSLASAISWGYETSNLNWKRRRASQRSNPGFSSPPFLSLSLLSLYTLFISSPSLSLFFSYSSPLFSTFLPSSSALSHSLLWAYSESALAWLLLTAGFSWGKMTAMHPLQALQASTLQHVILFSRSRSSYTCIHSCRSTLSCIHTLSLSLDDWCSQACSLWSPNI